MSSRPTPASRGGAVGKSQWMTTRDRGRDQEGVAEGAEAVPRAAVQPDEEDPREEEVADEVEDVERLDHVGEREERALQRLLPGDTEHLLDGLDPACVRERLSPVRLHRVPRDLVGGERTDHDGDLRSGVTPRQNLPDARHRSHRNTVASIVAMPLFWLALAVAIVAVIASAIYVTLKGREAFRGAKKLNGRSRTGSSGSSGRAARSSGISTLAAESGERLEAELAQLRRSRARLNVLTSAIDEVRDSIGRVTAVYPRK